MNFATIKKRDIADGPGVRVSLFVSGCTHHCEGCFNEIAWDFDYGAPFTEAVQHELLEALAPDYVQGLTLLGGEPFEPENQRALLPFLKRVVILWLSLYSTLGRTRGDETEKTVSGSEPMNQR